MKPAAAKTDRRAEPLYVHVARPRCPGCSSPNLLSYKTVEQGDGTLLRYSLCRDCHAKCKVILE